MSASVRRGNSNPGTPGASSFILVLPGKEKQRIYLVLLIIFVQFFLAFKNHWFSFSHRILLNVLILKKYQLRIVRSSLSLLVPAKAFAIVQQLDYFFQSSANLLLRYALVSPGLCNLNTQLLAILVLHSKLAETNLENSSQIWHSPSSDASSRSARCTSRCSCSCPALRRRISS